MRAAATGLLCRASSSASAHLPPAHPPCVLLPDPLELQGIIPKLLHRQPPERDRAAGSAHVPVRAETACPHTHVMHPLLAPAHSAFHLPCVVPNSSSQAPLGKQPQCSHPERTRAVDDAKLLVSAASTTLPACTHAHVSEVLLSAPLTSTCCVPFAARCRDLANNVLTGSLPSEVMGQAARSYL